MGISEVFMNCMIYTCVLYESYCIVKAYISYDT